MDKFEKILKEKLDQAEVPYNESHWEEFEEKLDQKQPSNNTGEKLNLTKIIGSIAAMITIVATTFYYINSDKGNAEDSVSDNGPNNGSVIEKQHKESTNPTANKDFTSEHSTATNSIPKGGEHTHTTNDKGPAHEAKETKESTAVNTDNTDPQPVEVSNLNTAPVEPRVEKHNIDKPDLSFTASADKVCSGEEIQVRVNNPEKGLEYKWEVGTGTILYGSSVEFSYSREGNYSVSLFSTKSGKEFSNTKNDLISVFPVPESDFTYEDNKEITLKDPYIGFTPKEQNLKSYHWDFGDQSGSETVKPDHIFSEKGTYEVRLITTNTYGCKDTTTEMAYIPKSFNLKDYAPTAFNPKSSIPENKVFIPRALEVDEVSFEMEIYDHAQNKVYSTDNANEPWNGRINNTGKIIPGDYSWKVVTIDVKGIKHTHMGTVKLVLK